MLYLLTFSGCQLRRAQPTLIRLQPHLSAVLPGCKPSSHWLEVRVVFSYWSSTASEASFPLVRSICCVLLLVLSYSTSTLLLSYWSSCKASFPLVSRSKSLLRSSIGRLLQEKKPLFMTITNVQLNLCNIIILIISFVLSSLI